MSGQSELAALMIADLSKQRDELAKALRTFANHCTGISAERNALSQRVAELESALRVTCYALKCYHDAGVSADGRMFDTERVRAEQLLA